MPKLSESLPMQLSHEEGEGWKMDTVDLANWLIELAQQVEVQGERLDVLEGKHKEQAPVDQRLVEEALEIALEWKKGFVEDSWALSNLQLVIDPLRRALEGDSNDQD